MAKALRTEDDHRTLSCAVCHTKLGVGTDAYVLRRQVIGPGVTETIEEGWLCSHACAMTHLRFHQSERNRVTPR